MKKLKKNEQLSVKYDTNRAFLMKKRLPNCLILTARHISFKNILNKKRQTKLAQYGTSKKNKGTIKTSHPNRL